MGYYPDNQSRIGGVDAVAYPHPDFIARSFRGIVILLVCRESDTKMPVTQFWLLVLASPKNRISPSDLQSGGDMAVRLWIGQRKGMPTEDKATKGGTEVDSSEEMNWVLRRRPHPSNSIQSIPQSRLVFDPPDVSLWLRKLTMPFQWRNPWFDSWIRTARLDPGRYLAKEACLEKKRKR